MQNDNRLVIMYIEGKNYDFSGIKVTIKSLREHYDGEIRVITKNVDDKLLDFLNIQKVNIIPSTNYNVIFETSPYNNKIIYILLHLKEQENLLKNYDIFYCDISDVYFKINPFSIFNKNLWFSLEDKTIGDCSTNSTWCRICYGDDTLNKISNRIVINSGLITGTYNQMLNLYQKMIDDLSKILFKINYPTTDQMIVNKLVYLDSIECVLDDINVNNMAQGIRTNIDNHINHQYKVNENLKNILYKKYE